MACRQPYDDSSRFQTRIREDGEQASWGGARFRVNPGGDQLRHARRPTCATLLSHRARWGKSEWSDNAMRRTATATLDVPSLPSKPGMAGESCQGFTAMTR